MSKVEYRVWWVPQVPMEAFYVSVNSYEEGRKVCDVLANYDLFQFENNVKPDYCNMGGVSFKNEKLTQGEWEDIDGCDADWILEEIKEYEASQEGQ